MSHNDSVPKLGIGIRSLESRFCALYRAAASVSLFRRLPAHQEDDSSFTGWQCTTLQWPPSEGIKTHMHLVRSVLHIEKWSIRQESKQVAVLENSGQRYSLSITFKTKCSVTLWTCFLLSQVLLLIWRGLSTEAGVRNNNRDSWSINTILQKPVCRTNGYLPPLITAFVQNSSTYHATLPLT